MNTQAKYEFHGDAVHGNQAPEYSIWQGMIRRCTATNYRDYPRYGGRGITVCERWLRDQQIRNTRTNRFITLKGETLTYTEWSLRLGGHPSLVHNRINRGWPESEAVMMRKRCYDNKR